MKQIVNLLFESRILKDINRSGYAFLGTGRESIAEHSFMTALICFVMAKMDPELDMERMVTMSLVHDLAEARTGDLNYVEKQYSRVDEEKAVSHLTRNVPFGRDIEALVDEFNDGTTREAQLVNDADQLSFVLELKKQADIGAKGPDKWLAVVLNRLKTDMGRKIAKSIMETTWDEWWMNDYSE